MARVLIEDRTGARLDIELTLGREEYGPDGPRADEQWHVVAFSDGRVYEPAPRLLERNAMLGEFATHDIVQPVTRPHVESGLCSCRPRFDAKHDEWVHANKRGEAADAGAETGPEPSQDGQGDPDEADGPTDTAEHGGEA